MWSIMLKPVISLKSFKIQSQTPKCYQARPSHAIISIKKHILRASDDDVEPVPPMMLKPLTPEEIQEQSEWLSNMVRLWLDEEWLQQDCHRQIGAAVGRAYEQVRAEGKSEAGDVVLGIASELMMVNFKDAFVGPFDCANKSVELLMLREGVDVCCTSEADKTAIARYEAELSKESESN